MKVSKEKIKMLRAKHDEKQSNLADLLDISNGQYLILENNPEKLTDTQLTVLADYFNVNKMELYEFDTADELMVLLKNNKFVLLIGCLLSNKETSFFFLGKINDAIIETIEKFSNP